MIVILKNGVSKNDVNEFINDVKSQGFNVHVST